MFATHRTVLAVVRDFSRIDRYVTRGEGNILYLTQRDDSVPQIWIPAGFSATKSQERGLASTIMQMAQKLTR